MSASKKERPLRELNAEMDPVTLGKLKQLRSSGYFEKLAAEAQAAGFSFLPVGVRDSDDGRLDFKKPLTAWNKLQYKDSRSSPEWIRSKLSEDYVKDRITGFAAMMGETNRVVLFECDGLEAYQKLSAAHPSPWQTRSKKGGHVYFRVPDSMTDMDVRLLRATSHVHLELPGGERVEIDIRAQGSYPVIPGSMHKAGIFYEADGSEPWPWKKEQREKLPEISLDWRIVEGVNPRPNQKSPPREVSQTIRERMEVARARLDPSHKPYSKTNPRPARLHVPRPKDAPPDWVPPPLVTQSDLDSMPEKSRRMREIALEVLSKSQPSVEGQGGRVTAFIVAQKLVHGMGLDTEVSLRLMLEEWNGRCSPPWSDADLRERVESAWSDGRAVAPGSVLKRFLSRFADEGEVAPPELGITDGPKKIREFLHLTDEERVNVWMQKWEDVLTPGLEDAARAMAYCCIHFTSSYCKERLDGKGGHGRRGRRPDRCGNPNCRNCARVEWEKNHEPHIQEEWPDQAYVYEGTLEAPEDYADEVKRVNNLYRRNLVSKPRWLEGTGTLLLFFDVQHSSIAASFGFLGSEMTKSEYLPKIHEAWMSRSELIAREYRETKDMVSVLERRAELVRKNRHRTGAGNEAKKVFPWLSTNKARERAAKKWKEEHPNLQRGQCDVVLEPEGPDGHPVYCRCLLHNEVKNKRTGKVVLEKRGQVRDDEWRPVRKASMETWIRHHYLPSLFTADT